MSTRIPDLSHLAAPMVNQSDLPFRLLVGKYGATCTYTQMLHPEKLLNDQDYFEFHLRDLQTSTKIETRRPVVVQLCGNDPELVIKGGRKVIEYCDAIGVLVCTCYIFHFDDTQVE
jgi:tRNA-dihydrouridine synthase 1